MSYILDALRRAEAERDRGGVPGLHAQPPLPTAGRSTSSPTRRAKWVAYAAGSAGVALLLAFVVWQGARREASPTVVVSPPTVSAVPTPAAAPAPIEPLPVAVAAAPSAPPLANLTPAPVDPPSASPRKVVAAAVPARSPASSATAPTVTVASDDARIPGIADLPEDVRRTLPTVSIGGSIYSASPASRVVIVNGQLFHEGDALAPGLVLQQIRLKSAVLAYRGLRYGITF